MNAKLSPQMTAALRHIESNLNSFGWCVRFYGHSTNTLAALVRRGLVEANPEARGQLRPVVTPTHAAVDIPAAVREYVDAERSGAGIIALNVAQAGIVTALQSADPKLGDTAAERRFRELVAANDGLPINVMPAAEGLAALEAIAAATPGDRTFDLCTEIQSQDGSQWQAIDHETIQARDIDHAVSLIGQPDQLASGTAWRVFIYERGADTYTVRKVEGVTA